MRSHLLYKTLSEVACILMNTSQFDKCRHRASALYHIMVQSVGVGILKKERRKEIKKL